jgi:hypothetical protein
MSSSRIKYTFIGDCKTVKTVGEYSKDSQQYSANSKQIFEKFAANNYKSKYEERSKIIGDFNNNYYFSVFRNDIFIMVIADSEYPERIAFEYIEEINKSNIYLLINEQGQLNKIGISNIRSLVERYQTAGQASKLLEVQHDIEDVRIDVRNNIKKVVDNIDNAENLESKSKKIQEGSAVYGDNAKALKDATCWNNAKLWVIVIVLIIIILLVIILPIIFSSKNSGSSSNASGAPTNSTNAGLLLI